MGKHYDLARGDTFIEPVPDALMELLGAAAPSLNITILNATTLQVTADNDNAEQAVSINSRWRWRQSATTAAHPGGAAGTHSVYVTGTANAITPGSLLSATVDTTDYTFGLQIRTSGVPATALYRKVGEVEWDGTSITTFRHMVGARWDNSPITPTAPIAVVSPVKVRGAASQTALLTRWEDSASALLTGVDPAGRHVWGPASDVNLYRSAANTLKTDDEFRSAGNVVTNDGLAQQVNLGFVGSSVPGIVFGSGSDTILYRSAADTLKTDDTFHVAGTLVALANSTVAGTLGVTGTTTLGVVNSGNHGITGTLSVSGTSSLAGVTATGTISSSNAGGKTTLALTSTGANTGLTIGGDNANLYRSAANTLKTDGNLQVVGTITAGGTSTGGDFTVAGNLLVQGNTTLGDAGTDTITINGPVTMATTLGVTGTTTLGVVNTGALTPTTIHATGAVDFDTTMNVDGAATLQSSLKVVGQVAFNNATPAPRPDYTITNLVTDRSIDVDNTTVNELADVVGTLVNDLIAIGLLQ